MKKESKDLSVRTYKKAPITAHEKVKAVSDAKNTPKDGCFEETEIKDVKRMSGREFIDVTIPDLATAYSPYSVSNHRRIETGFVEFIEDYSQSIPMSRELTIRIHVKEEASNEQRKEIRDAVRAHYAQQLTNIEFKQKNRIGIGLITFFMGIIVLASIFFLARDIPLLYETLMVLSWVLLWTAFDAFFLSRPALGLKERRYKRLQRADIIFKFKGEK